MEISAVKKVVECNNTEKKTCQLEKVLKLELQRLLNEHIVPVKISLAEHGIKCVPLGAMEPFDVLVENGKVKTIGKVKERDILGAGEINDSGDNPGKEGTSSLVPIAGPSRGQFVMSESKNGGEPSSNKSLNGDLPEEPNTKPETNDPLFPLEIQEMIVKNVKDTKTLMKCRLVDKAWMETVTKKLEELSLAYWRTWRPEPETVESIHDNCHFRPILKQKQHPYKKIGITYINLPPALQNWNHHGNPFPTKSLTICHCSKCQCWERFVLENSSVLDDIFIDFGKCLTTLALVEVKLTFANLLSVLVHTPNLKILTIERVQLPELDFRYRSREVVTEKVSRHLEHLRLIGEGRNHLATSWILELFGDNLVHLTLNNEGSNVLRCSKKGFTKLKQLKIINSAYCEFSKSLRDGTATGLERLSIRLDPNPSPELVDVANFIATFQASLKHLSLNVNMCEFSGYREYWKGNGVIFSKLESLSLKKITAEEGWKEMLQIGSVFSMLPKFRMVNI